MTALRSVGDVDDKLIEHRLLSVRQHAPIDLLACKRAVPRQLQSEVGVAPAVVVDEATRGVSGRRTWRSDRRFNHAA
jgi:hypothetical protein